MLCSFENAGILTHTLVFWGSESGEGYPRDVMDLADIYSIDTQPLPLDWWRGGYFYACGVGVPACHLSVLDGA